MKRTLWLTLVVVLAIVGYAWAEQYLATANGKGLIGKDGIRWRAIYAQTLSGDATGSSSGFMMSVADKTASYSVSAADCGKVINASTSGTKEFDLPAVTAVSNGWFVVVANGGGATLTVNPYAADSTILGLTNAAGDAISNSTAGNSMMLIKTSSGWQPLAPYGTWSDAN